jgi:Mg2+ and Co2+ transporter CorA
LFAVIADIQQRSRCFVLIPKGSLSLQNTSTNNSQTERMTSAFRRFRMQTFKDIVLDDDADGTDWSGNRTESIKKRHKRELEQAERENRENTSALLELRDLEDELSTLLRLFDHQQTVVQTMRDIYRSDELRPLTRNGRAFLDEALSRLKDYKAQTEEMLVRVNTTRNDYEKLLEMVQRQAQVDEVRWSRLQTELASSQNLSVMIFTAFTVIFLPLTFFTGLFGMNTLEWGGPDGVFLPLGTIGAVALPASALIVFASLVAAFSGRAQAVVKTLYKKTKRTTRAVGEGVEKLRPATTATAAAMATGVGVGGAAAAAKKRAREEMEAREDHLRRTRERGYDFWAAVRRQRYSEHRIPELNRKKG